MKMEESRQASQEEREETWIQEVAKAKGKELQCVILEEYGSRRHAAMQVSHRHGWHTGGTFVDGFCIMASIMLLMMTFLVNGSGAWSLGEVQFLPNDAIETMAQY
jgi:hypothetical protein